MPTRRPAALLAVVLPLSTVLFALPSCAGRNRSSPQAGLVRTVHPDVGAAEVGGACARCHEGVTPEIVKAWEAGPHGLNLVRCFVCHGSTGPDFRAKPAADGCAGCHSAQLETLPAGARQGCFSCHAPHELRAAGKPNPHRT